MVNVHEVREAISGRTSRLHCRLVYALNIRIGRKIREPKPGCDRDFKVPEEIFINMASRALS